VWNLHPFWEIGDGKIINHWLIAVFYPQNAPDFVGRYATLLVGMIGLAAAWKLVRRLFGETAGWLAGCLWIACPYLFFFERLAFSDAEAGAWVILTLLGSINFTSAINWRWALLAGLGLALAALFKFTALPFAVSVVMILLLHGRFNLRQRLSGFLIIAVIVGVSFIVPILYMLTRGGDFFGIAMEWIVGGQNAGGTFGSGIGGNFMRLWSQLTDYGSFLWAGVMLAGLVLIAVLRWRESRALVLGLFLPLSAITILGREVLPRHIVVALPYALMLGGAGIGVAIARLNQDRRARRMIAVGVSVILIIAFAPFALTAYRAPEQLPLPITVSTEHITEHSAGYGLREAALAFPQTTDASIPIIGSMFPDSCRRANFYADSTHQMICTDAPGLVTIQSSLQSNGAAYILVEAAGVIGLDFMQAAETNGWAVDFIASYPRPHETLENAAVILWRISNN
jgi:hypothetical protein